MAVLDNPKYASLAESGVFAPITDWFYGWEDSKNFKQNCLDMGTVDGELYGILYDPCGLALWANKQMLADAGYDAAPTNWEEFEEIAMACTDPANGVYGFATSTRTEEEGSTFQHGSFIYTSGTTLYDQMCIRDRYGPGPERLLRFKRNNHPAGAEEYQMYHPFCLLHKRIWLFME